MVDTLIECDRSPPVPTMSIAADRVSSESGTSAAYSSTASSRAGDLLGRLTFGAQGDDETDQLCRRGVAVKDRAHRCPRLLGGEVDAVEQGGEERGPSAVLFEMYHAVNLRARREKVKRS